MPGGVEREVHVAVGEIRWQQIEALVIGALDQPLDIGFAAHELAHSSAHLGSDAEQIRARALRVEVP